MNSKHILFAATSLFIVACSTSKQIVSTAPETIEVVEKEVIPTIARYNPSKKRVNDILHTKLEVSFDWQHQYMPGKATLTIKPYFHPVDSLILDAKSFEIKRIALKKGDELLDLQYTYKNDYLRIKLDRTYNRNEQYQVYIDYVAKPNERKTGGSSAISSDKGLYFINPLNETKNKPQQIWTQGETQSNSAWFPCNDTPNEKMTQEISMTVQNKYVTLSNGTLVFQTENPDGTRTDYWKQDKPHSVYLAMMVVGDFAVVKDNWRDSIPVNYFVEKEYEQYAKDIFGNTPEMIEFYSNKLGVDYPWDKYHQIIVRDYVSGAMENTSAVIHGDFVQQTKREMLDGNQEDVISHELFHHWFGDLVTAESWSNLPLNESFATYGEYLWREYKYGREAADYHIQGGLSQYLQESRFKQVNMIRFDYKSREDMFDSHSYAKGGRILHMLRKAIGDDAFFASLKLYLTRNSYKNAEMHQLRLACEEVTGEDLNWFFNQWFYRSGHPILNISHVYNDSLKIETLTVKQKQNFEKTPLYQLPIKVDIYADGKVESHDIWINEAIQTFEFKIATKPDLVNFDAEKMMLCKKIDVKSNDEWYFQYQNAPLYLDRYEAVKQAGALANKEEKAAEIVFAALDDKFWNIRRLALNNSKSLKDLKGEELKTKLADMAINDPKAKVRVTAIKQLNKYFGTADIIPLLTEKTNDQSYGVEGAALKAISEIDKTKGFALAKKFENEENTTILGSIAEIYADSATLEGQDFFVKKKDKFTGFSAINYMVSYEKYVKNIDNIDITNNSLPVFEEFAKSDSKYIKYFGGKSLQGLHGHYTTKESALKSKIDKLKTETPDSPQIETLTGELEIAKKEKVKISDIMDKIKAESKG